ncbi:MAG: hypothetical protein KAT90_15070 [Gammaproteobacteria bacterium]|nr:hypothetical protein [Gammaproteobacteria bacterium]
MRRAFAAGGSGVNKPQYYLDDDGVTLAPIEGVGGATKVVDVGIITQRHNRSRTGISATWPGDDSFSVSWAQSEDVRRYRILVTGGTAGDTVRVVEDATNEAQAEAWLALDANSPTSDVEYNIVQTSTANEWSPWQEMSKDPDDLSLSRLDFIGSVAGPFAITVEAE